MAWCFHLFKNIPQFVVIHTVKICSIGNEAEVDVFLEFSCQQMLAICVLASQETNSPWSDDKVREGPRKEGALLGPLVVAALITAVDKRDCSVQDSSSAFLS